MERALKSFLDGISDDDNVVNLETAVKNDNDDDEPNGEVIEQGSASGMLDMRAMAQRYQEMSSSDVGRPVVKARVEPALPGQLVRDHLLAPVVEVEDSDESRALLIAGVALAVLVTIVSTAAITAVLVKRSVMAEIHDMGLSGPQVSVTQNPATMATATDTDSEVAEWPATNPSALAAAKDDDDDDENELNFRESDVETLSTKNSKPTSAAVRPTPVTTPRPSTATPTTSPTPVATTATTKLPVPQPTEASTPDPTPKTKLSKTGEPCDEVLCLVEGRGCCGTAKKAVPAVAEVDTSLPERLDRDDIKDGLAAVDGRLGSCGTRFDVNGVVTLKLSIGPDGKVKQSSANKGEQDFQNCVSDTLKRARFTRTQQGANLSYPVILR